MADHATSDHPAVQHQLDRLGTLSPGADILGLDRITRLLDRLGDPHLSLPPVFHVAGTNGKGSTCAFLRAALEADGRSVHVYTSPHLVRFNERIRLAGHLVEDEVLAAVLETVLDQCDDIGASFFEVTTAAAFLLFARTPADACIVEVGLGGRLDATNVLPAPAVCGIAQIGIDHQFFLGDTDKEIAAEKAGIAKPGVPLVTQRYEPHIAGVVAARAADAKAQWIPMGSVWDAAVYRNKLHYRDALSRIEMPVPRLAGEHQAMNAALATAMLRHQGVLAVSESALRAAPLWAHWPARLQHLDTGPLAERIKGSRPDRTIWLDGGHNPAAGAALARHFRDTLGADQKLTIIIGMLANKDAEGFLAPLRDMIGDIHVVPVDGHDHHDSAYFRQWADTAGIMCSGHADIGAAADAVGREGRQTVLICGSLYLAGAVLKDNGSVPD